MIQAVKRNAALAAKILGHRMRIALLDRSPRNKVD